MDSLEVYTFTYSIVLFHVQYVFSCLYFVLVDVQLLKNQIFGNWSIYYYSKIVVKVGQMIQTVQSAVNACNKIMSG